MPAVLFHSAASHGPGDAGLGAPGCGDTVGAFGSHGRRDAGRPGPAVGDLLNPVPAQQARLLLVQGDVEAAESWTISRGLLHGDEPDYPRELGYLLLARVLLAQDRPDQAVPLLQRLRTAAAAQGRTGSLIEIQALLALALAADGDGAAALDALAEALLLGHPAGYLRVFADEGAPMRALVGRLVAAQRTARSAARAVPLDYLVGSCALSTSATIRAADAQPLRLRRAWSRR